MMDIDALVKLSAGAVVGLISIALGFQQIIKKWKGTSAETGILSLLHAELERMSAQNVLLAGYVDNLQLNANKLNLRVGELQIENQKLSAEIICLTQEVIKLRSAING